MACGHRTRKQSNTAIGLDQLRACECFGHENSTSQRLSDCAVVVDGRVV